jgi:hypothetical protein
MLPGDDAGIGARLALAHLETLALAAQRVADENGGGEDQLVIAEVGNQRAERRVRDRHADHQAEGVDRIDQRLAELACRRRLMVEVHGLRVMGEGGDQHIVGLGDGASDRMGDHVADLPLVEIASSHKPALG